MTRTNTARRLPAACGALAIAAGLLVIFGWLSGMPVLSGAIPYRQGMRFNTAVLFVCCGSALLLMARETAQRRRFAADALAGFTFLLSAAELAERLTPGVWRFDEMLFPAAPPIYQPGRMSMLAAIAFMLISSSILLRARPAQLAHAGAPLRRDPRDRVAHALVDCSNLIALSVLFGYLYGAGSYLEQRDGVGMILSTAVLFLIVGVGMTATHGDHGWMAIFFSRRTEASRVVRQLVPVAILAIAAAGVLRGAGEASGLFRKEVGLALFSVTVVVGFISVMVWFAWQLDRSEEKLNARERELLDSQERFRLVARATNDVIFDWDLTTQSVWWSEALTRVLGWTMDDVQPGNDWWLARIHPDDRPRIAKAIEDGLRGRGDSFSREYRAQKKDGSYIHVLSRSLILRDADGTPKRSIGVLLDATAQKLAQQQLEYARELLEEKVAQRTAELERTALALANSNRELEAFSYSVSHDLRAPLRSLDGFSRVVVEEYADRLDDRGRDYLQRIRAAAQRMGRLIDDLLGLSRVTRKDLERHRVDLSSLARRTAMELCRLEPERQVAFSIQDDLVAEGDGQLLQQVLENLIGNAWKFTARKAGAHIEFGATERNGQRIFFVRDNGAGFEPAYAHKLFIAFQRLHAINDFPGNGIGLATVKRILARHGGDIWAEGEPGQGATFSFTLHSKRSNEQENTAG
ncbi:MAG TPA: ATP-binding protein [Thermoanaerobaculia bacterium]|nr:ATP-binding protein [Thermoanaerobaculia bacterium]